ncbi:MAG: hypothetical protein QOH37_376 [Nocardioidaceae bacterium]|nr:hypothetical protein [Nocardioidaceae bacterium]
MADEERPDPGNDDPSLELPSLRSALRFGRKRDKKAVSPPTKSDDTHVIEPTATTAPLEPVEPATPPEPGEPLAPLQPVEPAIPAAPPSEPVPAPEPGQPTAPAASDAPTMVAPPEPPGPATTPGPIGLPETDSTAVLPAAVMAATDEQPAAGPPARRTLPRLHLPGPLVALLTGAVVGLALVGLTSASLHLCSSVRGTSSCGKPGFLLLLVITVAMVFLGSVLLRLAGVDAHGSTSFLGVGLLVVVILLALLPVIFHWWMVIVVPLVAMATYAAAWWLTTTYVEPGERVR